MKSRLFKFLTTNSDKESHKRLLPNPPMLLFEGFLCLIAIGTLLLKLPMASQGSVSWLEAAFTATSAVTVTGLVVVDTGTEFTLFGQCVILGLIQLGGLGLMTFAVLTALSLGFKLQLRHQLVAREAFNELSLNTARNAAMSIALFSIVTQLIGIAILGVFFVPELGWGQGMYSALFYTVSAFNNAGFALAPDSLSAYVGHIGINVAITMLFIVGGLGYVVIMECLTHRRWRKLSFYTRMILLATLAVNLVAFSVFFLLEYSNPSTLGGLASFSDKALAAWFQATTPRTAGFNTLDIGSLTMATTVMMLLLMFIGGAPNSTASGIKLSTFVVLMATTRAFLRGGQTVTFMKRTLNNELIMKSLATVTLGMIVIFTAIFLLSIVVTDDFMNVVFEVVSAFGTVGLSRGTTAHLGDEGQLIIMAVMLIGRLGPLTLGYLLTVKRATQIRYASVEFPVG
ncbi:MAG: potassium transporter TrkG [Oleibacter sp.]|nr:potassium transporter TrkG [Thalassolituus sp.]